VIFPFWSDGVNDVLEFKGLEKVNGSYAYRLYVSLPLGANITYFIDDKSFLVTRRLVSWEGDPKEELWENLVQGRDCISEIPQSRYARRRNRDALGRYRGGFIDGLISRITDALRRGAVEIHFQPVVELTTRNLYNVEVLARIRTDEGLMAATDFIDSVYQLGEIVELDREHIVARYTFPPSSDFYRGHFPGNPVTPGVLLVESMAQCGVVPIALHLFYRDLDDGG
jgi:hypothetical protein